MRQKEGQETEQPKYKGQELSLLFLIQLDGLFLNCGLGIRGHSLWQDNFVEVLVTCSSLPLTCLVFLAILLLCILNYRFVY